MMFSEHFLELIYNHTLQWEKEQIIYIIIGIIYRNGNTINGIFTYLNGRMKNAFLHSNASILSFECIHSFIRMLPDVLHRLQKVPVSTISEQFTYIINHKLRST